MHLKAAPWPHAGSLCSADLAVEAKPIMPARTVRSEAAGIAHDIAIEGWGERGWGAVTRLCHWAGQWDEGPELTAARSPKSKAILITTMLLDDPRASSSAFVDRISAVAVINNERSYDMKKLISASVCTAVMLLSAQASQASSMACYMQWERDVAKCNSDTCRQFAEFELTQCLARQYPIKEPIDG